MFFLCWLFCVATFNSNYTEVVFLLEERRFFSITYKTYFLITPHKRYRVAVSSLQVWRFAASAQIDHMEYERSMFLFSNSSLHVGLRNVFQGLPSVHLTLKFTAILACKDKWHCTSFKKLINNNLSIKNKCEERKTNF